MAGFYMKCNTGLKCVNTTYAGIDQGEFRHLYTDFGDMGFGCTNPIIFVQTKL